MHFTVYWRGEELFSVGLTRDTVAESPSFGDVSSLYLPVQEDLEESYEEDAQAASPRRRVGF